jgi:hypothetical protein
MKVISLHIDNRIFLETEHIVSRLEKSRNRYINDAIDFYNKQQKRLLLEKRLYKESDLIRDESMQVLRDFEEFEYGDETV